MMGLCFVESCLRIAVCVRPLVGIMVKVRGKDFEEEDAKLSWVWKYKNKNSCAWEVLYLLLTFGSHVLQP